MFFKKRNLEEECSKAFPKNFQTPSIPLDTPKKFLAEPYPDQTNPVPPKTSVALGGRKKRRTRKPKKRNKKSKKHHKKHSYKKL